MKYFYIAVQIKENEKFYAFVQKVHTGYNLTTLSNIPNIASANILPTKKRAYEVADYWNACFKRNGTYLFNDPNF